MEIAIDLIVYPKNSYIETLVPHMTVFGDRAFKEATNIKLSP